MVIKSAIFISICRDYIYYYYYLATPPTLVGTFPVHKKRKEMDREFARKTVLTDSTNCGERTVVAISYTLCAHRMLTTVRLSARLF